MRATTYSLSRPFTATTATFNGHLVVNVCGELDAMTVGGFVDLADDLLARWQTTMIINLTRVSFCSAGGLAVLLRLTSDAHSRGTPLAILASQHAVLRPVRILGLQPVLPLHATLADAAAWLDLPPRLTSESST